MGATFGDIEFYKGWRKGMEQALDMVRDELLEMGHKGQEVPIPIYEMLNRLQGEMLHGEHGKANLPPCENEEDLVFHNID